MEHSCHILTKKLLSSNSVKDYVTVYLIEMFVVVMNLLGALQTVAYI